MLSDADKIKIKLAIRDRIDELSLLLDQEVGAATDDDEDAKLHELASSNVDSALTETHKRELISLRRSLEWLDSDDGGYCESCGREIQSARLFAVPSARTCIECARKKETWISR